MSSRRKMMRAATVILAAAAAFLSAQAPASKSPAPLVRRDLLRTAPPVFPEIQRDLFSVARYVAPLGPGTSFTPMQAGDKPPEDQPVAPPPAVVRYVGYIKYASEEKPVALVLINGEAWAVKEGEPIGNGWTALRVTEKEIELQDPEGKKLVFPYQGEG